MLAVVRQALQTAADVKNFYDLYGRDGAFNGVQATGRNGHDIIIELNGDTGLRVRHDNHETPIPNSNDILVVDRIQHVLDTAGTVLDTTL